MTEICIDLETTGLNPLTDRIVCIGLKNDELQEAWVAQDEKELLQQFWSYIDSHYTPPTLVGYNIDSFDIPFLRFRTLLHRIAASSAPSVGRNSIDLMRVLFEKSGYRKFIDVALALGIEHDNATKGANVPQLWAEGNHQAIAAHCIDDLKGEWELYKRLKECGFV